MLSAFVTFVNWIVKNIGSLASYAINLLPESPLNGYMDAFTVDNTLLSSINYFIPIGVFLPIALAILTAYGIARMYWSLLRIGRMID